jgi:DNA-binding CsgD family transcriptional regulator
VAVRRWLEAGRGLVDEAQAAVADHEEVIGPIGAEGLAWCARLEAEAARLEDRDDPALWRTAVARFTGRHVYEAARSRYRLAAALLATDARDAAVAELRAVHEAAVGLGAEPLRAAVVDLARRGRVELEPSGRRPAGPGVLLTPREAEVLALLAGGRTNRQVGAALYISEKTASVHVSNILGKLGVGSRTEAVAVAAQRGLLPEPRGAGAPGRG